MNYGEEDTKEMIDYWHMTRLTGQEATKKEMIPDWNEVGVQAKTFTAMKPYLTIIIKSNRYKDYR